MPQAIIKRDGRTTEFHVEKIASAIEKAFQACAAMQDRSTADMIAAKVAKKLDEGAIEGTPTVEPRPRCQLSPDPNPEGHHLQQGG